MSFCSQLKEELCTIRTSECCTVAQCYGMMLFGRSFSYKEISLVSENREVVRRYLSLLHKNFGVAPGEEILGRKVLSYRVRLQDPAECTRVLSAFGYRGGDSLHINRDVFKRDCCLSAFIRGAFLACGQMSDPNRNYHAEFVIRDLVLAMELERILKERGLSPLRSMRANRTVLYFSRLETVMELLGAMNASKNVFALMDVEVTKTIRNRENRKSNSEIGNIGKQVEASLKEIRAIERLEQYGKLELLPPSLYRVAVLRREHPEASLNELCRLCEEPLTRSGLNHRLARILAEAERLPKEPEESK